MEDQAGRSVCAHIKGVKAVIHQNHGLFTSSRHSIDAAAFWASGHAPVLVPPDKARYSREHVGSDYIVGWLHFQALFDQIRATQPDMLD